MPSIQANALPIAVLARRLFPHPYDIETTVLTNCLLDIVRAFETRSSCVAV